MIKFKISRAERKSERWDGEEGRRAGVELGDRSRSPRRRVLAPKSFVERECYELGRAFRWLGVRSLSSGKVDVLKRD